MFLELLETTRGKEMEITDEIKPVEVFGDDKQEDIFYSLLNGKTVKETIETSRGNFVVKFPKQKDLMYIDRKIAAMRGGLPASSFDDMANFAMQKIAYLDVVIESGESWYNNITEKNKSFSWGDMPDTDFIDEVYVKAWSFRIKIQSNFRKNEGKTDKGTVVKENMEKTVDDGLFSGVKSADK